MGVQSLWQILAPVKSEETIDCLKGKKIAVDLAIWLVESQVTGMKMMHGKVNKPHLRNLFFRVSNFLRLGVKLVFVIDGTPPELKWEEMARRNEVRLGGGARGGARGGGRGGWRGQGRGGRGGGGGVQKKSRSHFACWLKECQELLELMGVPCIQSQGEAEAMCAALNGSGMVDGCMTEDGDAFLYGARIVYRNLNMATGKVDCYSMDDVEADLKLDRRRLVALSILLGCDYLPKGVPGIGKEAAMKFMRSIPSSVDPLNLFQGWRGGCASTCLTNEERDVRKKSLRVEGFPNEDVVKEFLQNKERPPDRAREWGRPLLQHLQQFNLVKMEWPVEYTLEKVVPLQTLFDLTHTTSDPKGHLQPASVVKLRVRQGVQCVEVKWHKPDEDKENDENPFYTTVEERELFTSVYPDVMEQFMVVIETKKAKGRGKKKKETSSSLQQDGVTEEEHHVVMDTASKHRPAGVDAPLTLDQEHLLMAKPATSQVHGYHGNKLRSRELASQCETGSDVGRSRFPSQEEVTHRRGDTDDEDVLMKLINLSLHDGNVEKNLSGGGRHHGKRAEEVQKDGRIQMRTQDMDTKAKPGKKCFKGKDLRSGKDSLVGLAHKELSCLKSKSHPIVSASTLGTRERKQTKKEFLQVTEDDSTEEKEEVEESFIEVLPLSQRLGGCCSLRGFIPKSRRTANQVPSAVASNAAKSAGHISLDKESGIGVQETLPQFSDEESHEINTVEIRSVNYKLSGNENVLERTKHSSAVCAGSEEPSVASEHSASPQEQIMDKRHFMPKDAIEPVAVLHTIDMLKLSPVCNQDSKVGEVYTPCQKLTPATHEVIDLTEDSPLNDRCMSAVYSAEEATIHQSHSAVTLGVPPRSFGQKKDGDDHTFSEEEVTYFQEQPEHDRLLQISNNHGNSTYSMKKDDSSFLKLDGSLAKFMDELSLVSNSTSVAVSFAEDDDSVFIVEDAEACLDVFKQERTYSEENSRERKEKPVNFCQGTVIRDSSNFQEKLPVSEVCLEMPERIGRVPEEEVDAQATQSEHTVQGDIEDITELVRREPKNVHMILDLKTNGDQDSSTVTEQTIADRLEDGKLTRKDTEDVNETILGSTTTVTLGSSGSRAKETCEPQQQEATIHQSHSAVTLGVPPRSFGQKKDGDDHTFSEEEVTYFQEQPEHDRLLQISNNHGNSTYSMKKDDSSFLKLDGSLAKFMDELSLVSNSTSVAVSFAEDDDSVFIVEDAEACLDVVKQERTYSEENSRERKEKPVNFCQGTVIRDSSNFQEKLLVSEVCLEMPERIGRVPEEEVDAQATQSEHTVQGDIEDITELVRREPKNVHMILYLKTNGDQDSSTVTEQTIADRWEDGKLTRKDTEDVNETILGSTTTVTLGSSGSRAKETCEPQQHEAPHPHVSHNEMGNLSHPLPLVKKTVKSRKGRASKTKRRHKLMKSSSLHDSVLIENGLMNLLQMMSPVQMLSNPGSQQGEGPLSEGSLDTDDPPSQSLSSAFHEEKTCMGPLCFSPYLTSPSASKTSWSTSPLGSTSLDTRILNLPRPDSPANLEQTASSIPEEAQAILSNSASGFHVSPCTKSSMPDNPADLERTASSTQEEPRAILANSTTGVHVSPTTNSSRLLRAQLMSMLSQLTPGDSPLIGSKVLKKPWVSEPSRLRHQKANSEGKRQIRSKHVQAVPNHCRDTVKLSNQENYFQKAILDETDGMSECTSDIKSKVPFQTTNVCVGDKSDLGSQETHLNRTSTLPQCNSTDEPRHKPKPRSLSQPTRTVPSAKRNVRSKHKSCSQPVRSHTRSRSKSSVKGFQRRESLLEMESSLAKILEGLSI